jgi:hypothetical protein
MVMNQCAICGARHSSERPLVGTDEACRECGNKNWKSPVANENTVVAGFAALKTLANDFEADPNIMDLRNEPDRPQ